MGNALAEPVTEKHSADGEAGDYFYGVSEMQGWRPTMEDAYITTSSLPEGAKLFAVFDGHGGDEVSKFCSEHFAQVLQEEDSYQEGEYPVALKQALFQMDEMLRDPKYQDELEEHRDRMIQEQVERYKSADNPDPFMQQIEQIILEREEAEVEMEQARALKQSGGQLQIVEGAKLSPEEKEQQLEKAAAAGQAGQYKVVNIEKVSDQAGQLSTEVIAVPTSPSKTKSEFHEALEEQLLQEEMQLEEEDEFFTAAGATAVMTLVIGNTLYCANVGDSRAVMCRKGYALALSEDHKPLNPIERNRIYKAGGYINEQGRICDDLNLSRSIGDLRFKRNESLNPEDQIVTADPDIRKFTIKPEDHFMVIACDGVWDVMSNQEVIDFVIRGIQSGETKISKIVEGLLDNCVSPNLYQTGGIGGDNMTCIIVLFKPIEELRKSIKVAGMLKKTITKIFG